MARALRWPELDVLMSAFLVRLPERPRVLDAGCGPGHHTRLLRGHGARVVGLDSSFGVLRSTSLSGAVQADIGAVPLRRGSVDGVWCQALLHVARADVPRVLTEFARVTRPAGALHMAVSEGDGESWDNAKYGAPRRYVHHREAPLRVTLAAAGWHVVAVERMRTVHDWLIVLAHRG